MVRVALAFLLFAAAVAGAAQADARKGTGDIAIVNVHVVSPATGKVLTDRAVLVEDGLITAIGSSAGIKPPEGTRVLDAGGKYLVPGLTDAHVHVEEYMDARPQFGDAPIFLRSGITSVFNLRGFPEHIQMREQIERGDLVAPMLYTSGEFVNEPRVTTPEEAAAEVRAQAAAGYDLIKFREVVDHDVGVLTTTGVNDETFAAILATARQVGLPVLGHAPHGLRLKAVEEHGLALAHIGELLQLNHFPRSIPTSAKIFSAALVLLVLAALLLLALRAFRGNALRPEWPQIWAAFAAVGAAIAAAALARALLPGGASFGSHLLIGLMGLLLVGVGVAGFWLFFRNVRSTGDHPFRLGRATAAFAGLSAVVLATSGLWAAVPMSLRSTPAALNDSAQRVARSGAPIVTTLVLYDEFGRLLGGEHSRISRHAVALTSPGFQKWNRSIREGLSKRDWRRWLSIEGHISHYDRLASDMAQALHRAGVPLIAGTDAFGVGIVPPGESLHAELDLLIEAGLAPLDALRAATTNPAQFLGKAEEFGDIAPGMRADMLLVSGNPLQDLRVLREPTGIVLRGMWIPRDDLDRMLAGMVATAARPTDGGNILIASSPTP
jgi:imidazolonepropionase-like amidohydrolase